MPAVGRGVREIRVRTDRAYRVFYVASFAEAVYVLHVFEKNTQKTSARDFEMGRDRFKTVIAERNKHAS